VSPGTPSAPASPVNYVPTPVAPTTYQSVIPKISYQDQAEFLKSTTGELNKALYAQYQQAGTPYESGAWQKGTRAQEAASYAASLPKGDIWTAQNTGGSPDPYGLARNSATERYGDAQEQYRQALASAKDREGPKFGYTTPSWANRDPSEFAVKKDDNPAPSPAPAPEPAPEPKRMSWEQSRGGTWKQG
jgi:hypothetical protein